MTKIRKSFGEMKWGDFVLAGVVVALCVILWGRLVIGFFDKAQYAEVVVKGEVVLRYDLATQKKTFEKTDINSVLDTFSEEKTPGNVTLLHMTSQGIHFDLDLQDGKIRFSKSDCPDQVCVHTGNIYRTGQISACVPANTLIRITGGSAGEDDGSTDINLK
ncbi:MAG: NusG domain II-containing protein [Saccharofermentanales bacterium]